mmetsp:Transcript_25502/g.82402  ORF Transcript_25502/g.82402 Transcript_25502/m.82402 type:complete len:228 (-) Transcript_25502:187-870(-)
MAHVLPHRRRPDCSHRRANCFPPPGRRPQWMSRLPRNATCARRCALWRRGCCYSGCRGRCYPRRRGRCYPKRRPDGDIHGLPRGREPPRPPHCGDVLASLCLAGAESHHKRDPPLGQPPVCEYSRHPAVSVVKRVDRNQPLMRRSSQPHVRNLPAMNQPVHCGNVGVDCRRHIDARGELDRPTPGLLPRPAEATRASLTVAEEQAVGAEEEVDRQGLAERGGLNHER